MVLLRTGAGALRESPGMNEPERGPNRPMASGRRLAATRLGRPTGSDADTQTQRVQPRIPWSRRVGIVAVLVVLGGTVVLAGGFANNGKPAPSGSPSQPASSGLLPSGSPIAIGPTPRKAPVLSTPASATTSKRTWTARVTLPATGIARKDLQVRIYRNDQAVLDVPVRKGASMPVRNIPLKSGANAISAVFVAPGGEGPRSNVVTLTLDDVVPRINLIEPQDHGIVNAPTVTITGRTEGGAKVVATNLTQPYTGTATADADGQFSVDMALDPGGNDLTLTATDVAGNTGRLDVTLTRGTGGLDGTLTLSRTIFRTRQLPATFDVTFLVIDAQGVAVDGAPVTFSLSPPGAPTSTYAATTEAGLASWIGVTLSEGTQAGDGLVTARVTLPGGSTIQKSEPFTVK
jgi:Bacterial Ig domain